MRFKIPRDTDKISWTKHSIEKMKFYGLSEHRIKRVLRNPRRMEEGIAPGTLAAMQPAGSKRNPCEIWLMYVKTGDKKRIISAWRYPGTSKACKKIPIPEEIRADIEKEIRKFAL